MLSDLQHQAVLVDGDTLHSRHGGSVGAAVVESGNPDLVTWLVNHGCASGPLPTLEVAAEPPAAPLRC